MDFSEAIKASAVKGDNIRDTQQFSNSEIGNNITNGAKITPIIAGHGKKHGVGQLMSSNSVGLKLIDEEENVEKSPIQKPTVTKSWKRCAKKNQGAATQYLQNKKREGEFAEEEEYLKLSKKLRMEEHGMGENDCELIEAEAAKPHEDSKLELSRA